MALLPPVLTSKREIAHVFSSISCTFKKGPSHEESVCSHLKS